MPNFTKNSSKYYFKWKIYIWMMLQFLIKKNNKDKILDLFWRYIEVLFFILGFTFKIVGLRLTKIILLSSEWLQMWSFRFGLNKASLLPNSIQDVNTLDIFFFSQLVFHQLNAYKNDFINLQNNIFIIDLFLFFNCTWISDSFNINCVTYTYHTI